MFPPGTWTKLQDLSLVYFDWTWTVMGEITQENVRIYYTKMTSLFSAIGNNLPNLGKLELTHSWILRDDIYLWLFCQDPPAQFSDLLSEEEWRDGRLGWHKEKKRFLPRITAAATSIKRRCQMHLDTVLKKKVELTPLARSLTFFSIHNATERIDASTAVIAWCTSLRHLDLTDFDIVTDVRKVSPEHYRRGFCLPSVHRIYNLTGQPTALAVAAIQQPDSETMTRLWKGYNESLPAEGRLEFILKSLVLGAPKLQDLYIGVDSRQTVNGMDHVKLSSSHIQQLLSFKSLNILELENVDPASCMMCLEALSIQLKKVTITNVLINFARILSSMPQIREIILRNTNAVLYDDVDENQIVEFDGNPPLQRRLQRLSIEYTVPLTLVEYIFSKLPDLEYLALGHGSHRNLKLPPVSEVFWFLLCRYSSRGSISRLTPPTWKYLLRTSNLTKLRTLSIPVLYQPGLHPDTQISILDYEDMVDLFKYLPSLEKAHVHRRDYSRFGDQPSFPQYMITDPRYSFIHPGDF
ncbi:uncharacterized protein LOC111708478 [Eurytemora carolleeae]|uniref:uncharacterized protein LOC111708478 n=1 Tax=Eurytemora carolleeae TaxID=1294199 RepID=UPI000C75EBA6|nr:uncharacterized protein LOC111708478 [Eurytemora carolleeae]|eukprot:XP_023337635.1 uncharacterized protein LOC111708478 [Eurytemora affinis]